MGFGDRVIVTNKGDVFGIVGGCWRLDNTVICLGATWNSVLRLDIGVKAIGYLELMSRDLILALRIGSFRSRAR